MISFASMHLTFFGVKKWFPSVSVAGCMVFEGTRWFRIEIDPTFDCCRINIWFSLRLHVISYEYCSLKFKKWWNWENGMVLKALKCEHWACSLMWRKHQVFSWGNPCATWGKTWGKTCASSGINAVVLPSEKKMALIWAGESHRINLW